MPVATTTHDFDVQCAWTGSTGEPIAKEGFDRSYEVNAEGKDPIRSSSAPAFSGDASLYNPEETLIAALVGCHMLSYLALASRRGLSVTSYTDRATGTLGMKDGKMRMTRIVLRPRVEVADANDVEGAKKLHERAHQICFIANSLAVEIAIEPEAVVQGAG